MPNRETGKTRSQRIELDYHRRRNVFTISRSLLVLLAMILVGGYAAFALLGEKTSADSRLSRLWAQHASTGPLTEVHAAFETDCAKCHGDGFGVRLAHDAWKPGETSDNIAKSIEMQSCNTVGCHRIDHHFITKLKDREQHRERNCILCHRDHLGRDHDIASVSNSACTNCHAQLEVFCQGEASFQNRSIRAFTPDSHGEFAVVASRQDPGAIKFDHFQHLQPGQTEPSADGSPNEAGFAVDRLADKWRHKYAAREGSQLVQLTCDNCHEWNTVATDIPTADDATSRYFAPIEFDRHCQACHALGYPGQSSDMLPLPHAAPVAEITSLLRTKIEAGQIDGRIRTPNDSRSKTLPPGNGPGKPAAVGVVNEEFVRRVLSLLDCDKCHQPEHYTTQYLTDAANGTTTPLIPPRWFHRGAFHHGAHARMDCRFCHGQVYEAGDSQAAKDQEIVMIDGIARCVLCHRPSDVATPTALQGRPLSDYLYSSFNASSQPTWASDRCVECHSYHWTRNSPSAATDPATHKETGGGSP